MLNISYKQQVNILKNELLKVFDYVDLAEVHKARHQRYKANELKEEDIPTFIMYANYAGSILRITYYKFIHQLGFDPRALWDALIMVYHFQGVYDFTFESCLKEKEVKDIIGKTRFPEWTTFGLIGGDIRQLITMGEAFNHYMANLQEA